jgi:hypothetical protein
LPRKLYTLTYPDRSRKNIDRIERDSLELSGSIKKTSDGQYKYIGPIHTFHTMADLGKLRITAPSECQRFLEGRFIFVDPQKVQHIERLETVGGMTARLIKQGVVEPQAGVNY